MPKAMQSTSLLELLERSQRPTRRVGVGSAPRAPEACGLCGSSRVEVDEVPGATRLSLHECARCEHRWTSAVVPRRPARPRVALRPARPAHPAVSEEVAIAS